MTPGRPYSRDAYRELVGRIAAEGYRFAAFTDAPTPASETVYLRHDVDYSLASAVKLAELNSELGARGTFFVQLRAQFYNLLSPVELARVQRLVSLGQWVALHHEHASTAPAASVADDVVCDFDLLRTLIPSAMPAFSWHRPTAAIIDTSDFDVPGLVNAYGRRFFRDIVYLSDSTHRRSVDELEGDVLASMPAPFQLLLHPVNWISGGSSGVEILVRGWIDVLRDHERTLLENRTFVNAFPDGMPPRLLEQLEHDLLAAAAGEQK